MNAKYFRRQENACKAISGILYAKKAVAALSTPTRTHLAQMMKHPKKGRYKRLNKIVS